MIVCEYCLTRNKDEEFYCVACGGPLPIQFVGNDNKPCVLSPYDGHPLLVPSPGNEIFVTIRNKYAIWDD